MFKTVAVRLSEDQLQALEAIAQAQQREVSAVLDNALAQHLSLPEYHRGLIEEGIREDDAGETVNRQTVRAMIADRARR